MKTHAQVGYEAYGAAADWWRVNLTLFVLLVLVWITERMLGP
jgi:hypothetical protein